MELDPYGLESDIGPAPWSSRPITITLNSRVTFKTQKKNINLIFMGRCNGKVVFPPSLKGSSSVFSPPGNTKFQEPVILTARSRPELFNKACLRKNLSELF